MTTKKTIPLTERPIPGITFKQVWPGILLIVAIVAVYYTLTAKIKDAEKGSENAYRQSQDNNVILKEIQQERKELERVNNIRLTNIELDQREAKIRLTFIEQQLKINPPK